MSHGNVTKENNNKKVIYRKRIAHQHSCRKHFGQGRQSGRLGKNLPLIWLNQIGGKFYWSTHVFLFPGFSLTWFSRRTKFVCCASCRVGVRRESQKISGCCLVPNSLGNISPRATMSNLVARLQTARAYVGNPPKLGTGNLVVPN